jgi:hypothetical protein
MREKWYFLSFLFEFLFEGKAKYFNTIEQLRLLYLALF